jgi:iron complex transport system substrate-binding protein
MSIQTTPLRRSAITLVALSAATIVALTSCSRGESVGALESTRAAFSKPVSITNCERQATYDAPPQRIVSMNDHVTETLIEMGVGNRIIGMGYGDKDNPLPAVADQFKAIPSLASEYPTFEQIRDLDPDLVVGGMRSAFDDKNGLGRDRLEDSGIQTFLFSEYCSSGLSDIDVLRTDFTQLGDILGVPEGARALTTSITGRLDAVTARLDAAGVTPTRTFFYDSGSTVHRRRGGYWQPHRRVRPSTEHHPRGTQAVLHHQLGSRRRTRPRRHRGPGLRRYQRRGQDRVFEESADHGHHPGYP